MVDEKTAEEKDVERQVEQAKKPKAENVKKATASRYDAWKLANAELLNAKGN